MGNRRLVELNILALTLDDPRQMFPAVDAIGIGEEENFSDDRICNAMKEARCLFDKTNDVPADVLCRRMKDGGAVMRDIKIFQEAYDSTPHEDAASTDCQGAVALLKSLCA